MHARYVAVLALIVVRSAHAAPPIRLQALVPTSGSGVELVLDGDVATGWRMEGDPVDEGLLLRWEQPATFDYIVVTACPGSAPLTIEARINGEIFGNSEEAPAAEADCGFPEQKARSVYIKVERAGSGPGCVGKVQLFNEKVPLELLPPRTVEGSIQASSVLEPAAAYQPGFLFDGRLDFGWAEGTKGAGAGESLTVTLKEPLELSALELWNGHQRSEDHFRKNARASRLSLSVEGGKPVALTVKDKAGSQVLKLPKPLKGQSLKLTVDKAKAGSKFQDLVLSELRLVDAQGALSVRTPDLEEQRKALLAQVAGTGLEKIVDRRWNKRCEEAESYVVRTLKLRSNGSFYFHDVVAETGGNPPEYDETMEGAWVVKKVEAPWATVELFGRRHRFDTVLEKVAGDWEFFETESQRAGGGTLQLARVADLGEQEFQKLVAEWAKAPQKQSVDCVGKPGHTYAELVAAEAFIIRGKTVNELLSR